MPDRLTSSTRSYLFVHSLQNKAILVNLNFLRLERVLKVDLPDTLLSFHDTIPATYSSSLLDFGAYHCKIKSKQSENFYTQTKAD
jgi:hypothetical protein